jgi:hypothetical protein
MARFTHPSISSTGDTTDNTWVVEGGTIGDGAVSPTFNGAPMFSGGYNRSDSLCHFHIDVDMDNITNFGSGQYYVKLPFPSKNNYVLSDGGLHDISTGDEYQILGHVNAESDILTLLSIASNGKHVPFTKSVPVNLAIADNFHIAGMYEVLY